MAELPSIKLRLYEELEDPEFRRGFFVAESSAEIARQLVRLRARRGLSQQELAEKIDTKQPAISRVESASYRGWSLSNLQKIADAQDARLRVVIEPWEDVRDEYRDPVDNEESPPEVSALKALGQNKQQQQEPQGIVYGLGKSRTEPSGVPDSAASASWSVVSTGGSRGASAALLVSRETLQPA